MAELSGSVAIVTGAAGGVGREVVRLLLAAGASVVAEDLDPAVTELETPDDERVATVVGDVADSATARAAVETALERFGRLDILVNNAARFLTKPVLDTTDDEWDAVMRTNVRGVFVHCREALPRLADDSGGVIVNVASISGVVGLADQVAYSRARARSSSSHASSRSNGRARGVRVNAVAPGAIDTPFLRECARRRTRCRRGARADRGGPPARADRRAGRDRRDDRLPRLAGLTVRERRDPDGRRGLHRSVGARTDDLPLPTDALVGVRAHRVDGVCATVDGVDAAGDEGGFVAEEEGDDVGDLLRRPSTSHRREQRA